MLIDRRRLLKGLGGIAALNALPEWGLASVARPSIGVVGGGIIGASIAFHLARAGASVTLFEKTGPASGATGKSFAWINAYSDSPGYRDLRLQSLLAYRNLDRHLRLGITWGGSLTWKRASVSRLTAAPKDLLAVAKSNDHAGYSSQIVDAEAFTAIAPNLKPGQFDAAVYASMDGHLDPVQVTKRFLNEARKHGANIVYPCAVTDLIFSGEHLTGVCTSQGKYQVDRLIIAAGIDTAELTSQVGYLPPLEHSPGILAHSEPIAPLTRTVNDGPEAYFKQMSNGTVVGGDAYYVPDIPAHIEIINKRTDFPTDALRAMHGLRILEKIAHALPGARDAGLKKLTLGFRPKPKDGFPIVGFVPGSQSVYIAVMHSGVTLAPIMGEYIRREILTDQKISALTAYRPDRFAESETKT